MHSKKCIYKKVQNFIKRWIAQDFDCLMGPRGGGGKGWEGGGAEIILRIYIKCCFVLVILCVFWC